MLITLIVALAFTSLFGGAALLVAGYLFGQNKGLSIRIVEGKRRERRQGRDLARLHDKLSQKAGLGSLTRRVFTEPQTPTVQRRVMSPSQVISELQTKQVPKVETVPAGVKQQFLQEVAQ